MIVLQEQSYEDAAEVTGCAIGTLKSRVHRARLQLRAFSTGERTRRSLSDGGCLTYAGLSAGHCVLRRMRNALRPPRLQQMQ